MKILSSIIILSCLAGLSVVAHTGNAAPWAGLYFGLALGAALVLFNRAFIRRPVPVLTPPGTTFPALDLCDTCSKCPCAFTHKNPGKRVSYCREWAGRK